MADSELSGAAGAIAARVRSSIGEPPDSTSAMEPQPGYSLASTAFVLGWQMAELYRPDRFFARAPSDDSLADLGSISVRDATLVKLEQLQRGLMKLSPTLEAAGFSVPDLQRVMASAHGDRLDPEALRALHGTLLGTLHAADDRLGRAYELGRSLADTCLAPRSLDDMSGYLNPARVAVLDSRLAVLSSVLPPLSARTVRLSLDRWRGWMEGRQHGDPAGAADGVLMSLRKQGELWRALLAGDLHTSDMLEAEDYIAVNARVNRRTRSMIAGLIYVYWMIVLALMLIIAGSVTLIVVVKNSASGIAAVVGLISSVAFLFKGVGIITEVRRPVIDRELEVAIASRITLAPSVGRDR